MKRSLKWCVAGAAVLAAAGSLLPSGAKAAGALLTQADFSYVGAFKLPGGSAGSPADTFDYSGSYVAGNVYDDPANGKSLFIKGYLSGLQVSSQVSVAQVKIPAVIQDPNAVGVAGLATATRIQGFADPSRGIGSSILTSAGFGSLVVYRGKLIGTESIAYDGNCSQRASAWVSSTDFAQSGQATGPYAFSEAVTPRILGGGFMALVPPEWRAAIGAPVVSGNGPTSIISCGTPGPSLHAIDADALVAQPGASTRIASAPLVYYEDGAHSTLGLWNSNRPGQVVNGRTVPSVTVSDPHGRGTFELAYEDNSMRIQGVLFADGTSSVLFFGNKGLGPYCYGTGAECNDPDHGDSKGDHAYPYTEFVWAYNVNDLLAVKQGTKQPWDVVPYTGWAFKVFGDGSGGRGVGVSWDPETRLAYMVIDRTNYPAPLVHVFRVGGGTTTGPATPTPTPPAPPTAVRVIG